MKEINFISGLFHSKGRLNWLTCRMMIGGGPVGGVSAEPVCLSVWCVCAFVREIAGAAAVPRTDVLRGIGRSICLIP